MEHFKSVKAKPAPKCGEVCIVVSHFPVHWTTFTWMEALQTCHTIDSINHLGGSGWCDRKETSVEPIFRWCDCIMPYMNIQYTPCVDVRVFVSSFQNNRILNWLYACFTCVVYKQTTHKTPHLTHWINTINTTEEDEKKERKRRNCFMLLYFIFRTYCFYMFSTWKYIYVSCIRLWIGFVHIKHNTRIQYVHIGYIPMRLWQAALQKKALFTPKKKHTHCLTEVADMRVWCMRSLNISKRTSRSLHIALFTSSFLCTLHSTHPPTQTLIIRC